MVPAKEDDNTIPRVIREAHFMGDSYSSNIRQSDMCGCYDCLRIFKPERITEWVLSAKSDDSKLEFCLCPFCGIDSVLGDKQGFPITNEFLSEMNSYWFAGKVPELP